MDQQTKFKTALAALAASAETKDRKLTKADVKEFLEDMDLGEEQMKLVYAYLASKHIHVEGAELPKVEDTPYSQEEQEFLKQYEKDRKAFRQCAEEEKAGLFAKAADGDVQLVFPLLTQRQEKRCTAAGVHKAACFGECGAMRHGSHLVL